MSLILRRTGGTDYRPIRRAADDRRLARCGDGEQYVAASIAMSTAYLWTPIVHLAVVEGNLNCRCTNNPITTARKMAENRWYWNIRPPNLWTDDECIDSGFYNITKYKTVFHNNRPLYLELRAAQCNYAPAYARATNDRVVCRSSFVVAFRPPIYNYRCGQTWNFQCKKRSDGSCCNESYPIVDDGPPIVTPLDGRGEEQGPEGYCAPNPDRNAFGAAWALNVATITVEEEFANPRAYKTEQLSSLSPEQWGEILLDRRGLRFNADCGLSCENVKVNRRDTDTFLLPSWTWSYERRLATFTLHRIDTQTGCAPPPCIGWCENYANEWDEEKTATIGPVTVSLL